MLPEEKSNQTSGNPVIYKDGLPVWHAGATVAHAVGLAIYHRIGAKAHSSRRNPWLPLFGCRNLQREKP